MLLRNCKHIAALFFTLLYLASLSHAQIPDAAAREAEWQSYKLPSTRFARYLHPSKAALFCAPVEWQPQGVGTEFKGKNGVELEIIVEEIPDGLPLGSYVAAVLQNLRDLPGGADSLLIRRAQMMGLDAREIMFEMPDVNGVMMRRIIWVVAEGPRAFSFIFIAPPGEIDEIEPYFKAVVQSAIMIGDQQQIDKFESLRSNIFDQAKPSRIDEIQSLVAAFDGTDPAARAKAVSSLAAIFKASPGAAIDLILDRRPMVRASAIEAIAMSGNKALLEFLPEALDDKDSFVAERAARAFKILEPAFSNSLADKAGDWQSFNSNRMLRLAPFVDAETRARMAAALFKRAQAKNSAASSKLSAKPKANASRARGQTLACAQIKSCAPRDRLGHSVWSNRRGPDRQTRGPRARF